MSKQLFIKKLTNLAVMSGFNLNDSLLEFYDQIFQPYGYDRVILALDELGHAMGQGAKFPMPATIKAKMGIVEVSDESKARDISARIINAVSKYGWNNENDAKEHVGAIGWYVVEQQGGWRHVSDLLTDSNTSVFQAQWRDLAMAAMAKDRNGCLNEPPDFDKVAAPADNAHLRNALAVTQGQTPVVATQRNGK